MKKYLLLLATFATISSVNAQEYEFTNVYDLNTSEVKSQGKTGTCWSFSTTSFLESETYRLSGEIIDLSEIYNVRKTYPEKARNYVMRQAKAQFSQGGLGHDVINSIAKYGLVPESAYSGLVNGATSHNHKKIVPEIKAVLDTFIKKDGKGDWFNTVEKILDTNLGKAPSSFSYKGETYSPESFLKKTKIKPENYVTITSFKHQAYYTNFILNIPDNFSNGSFYNLPLDEYVQAVDDALKCGYTLELDCDVSEDTFSSKYGLAVVPKNTKDNKKSMSEIVSEVEVSPDYREEEFNNFHTTDDHLMHIVGLVKDQKGNEYYKVKNSWGSKSDRVGNGGYIYMSKAFFKLKSISVLVHKKALKRAYRKNIK